MRATVETEWQGFFNKMFVNPGDVPKQQHDDLRAAFYAGALVMMNLTVNRTGPTKMAVYNEVIAEAGRIMTALKEQAAREQA